MSTTTENKLVKSVMDSAVVVGLAAGIGYLGNKVLKEDFLDNPSKSITSYGKWVIVLSGSMYAKKYLEEQKIIPKSV